MTAPRIAFDAKKIDDIFAPLNRSDAPGAAVGIALAGRPVYRQGFGLASLELPVLLSPGIRMRIASTSKHFACLAYLLLCEEGLAGIDDPVGRHLPELHPVNRRVTMRQLMGHVSGLIDAKDISLQFSGIGRAVSSDDLLALYRDIDQVNFAPGTNWTYNNGGFLLLTFVIERITGRSFETVLRERVFLPVGMYETLVRRWDTDFVPNSATLHMTRPDGGYERAFIGVATAAEGGIVSTIDDMLRWLAHMDAPVVGSAQTWRTIKTPQILANGTSTGYGLGLISGNYRGVQTLYHAGGTLGGNAQMLKVPAAALNIIVMCNRQDVFAQFLVEKILDACLPGLDPLRESVSGPVATGTFRSPTTGRVIQLLEQDGGQIVSLDSFDMAMGADEHGVLSPTGLFVHAKQEIILTGDPERPTSLEFREFGNVDRLLPLAPPPAAGLGSIAGRFQSAATGTEAILSESAQGPRLHTIGRFGSVEFSLEALAPRIWRSRSVSGVSWCGGILSFDEEGTSFDVATVRTRALRFRRID